MEERVMTRARASCLDASSMVTCNMPHGVRDALEGRAGLLLSLGAENERRLAAAAVEHLGTAAAATGGGVAETWS
jgi:hypothetical protein